MNVPDIQRSEEACLRGPEAERLPSAGRVRRFSVILLGLAVAGMICLVSGLTLARGTWWYSIGTDQALDQAVRARVEVIQAEVEAAGGAPEAVAWLDAALDPGADPTTVRIYLLSAMQALEATGDPGLAEVAGELRAIVNTIRQTSIEGTATHPPLPTVEWP